MPRRNLKIRHPEDEVEQRGHDSVNNETINDFDEASQDQATTETTAEKPSAASEAWDELYEHIIGGATIEEALASLGWSKDHVVHAPRVTVAKERPTWKDILAKRSAKARERMSKGEEPFDANSPQYKLYHALLKGVSADEITAEFGWKSGAIGSHCRWTSMIVGMDLVKTTRKGKQFYQLDTESALTPEEVAALQE